MSAYAKTFTRVRNWLDALDGGDLRDLSPWERRIQQAVRDQAAHLIGFMA